MNSENKNPKKENKKNISGSGGGQLLRALLNTSVTWCLIFRIIHANIGSDRLLQYVLIAAVVAAWIIVPNILYRSYGAGKVVVYRIVMPVFYLILFNVLVLILIMMRMGTDSGFFRLCACLTIISAVVYLIDLFYQLSHFAKWAGSDRKAKKQSIEPAENETAEWAKLPEGILKKRSRVFMPLWLGGAILILFAATLQMNFLSSGTSNGSAILIAVLFLFCLLSTTLIMVAVAGFVQSKISNRKKYRVKRLDDGEKKHE